MTETTTITDRDQRFIQWVREAADEECSEWASSRQVARLTPGKNVRVVARDLAQIAAKGSLERAYRYGQWWYRLPSSAR